MDFNIVIHKDRCEYNMVKDPEILVSLLYRDGLVLPYSMDIYDKDIMSKIEITQNLISLLPKPKNKGLGNVIVSIVVKL